VDDALIDDALDGDGLSPGHRVGVSPTRSKIDQRATATVVDDEHIAEYLGHVAPDSRRASGLQAANRCRLQKHDALRPPILG
jgi:hypothetical protein